MAVFCDEDDGGGVDVDDGEVALVAIARAPEVICDEVCEPAAEGALKADCALNAARKFARNGRFVDILEESECDIRYFAALMYNYFGQSRLGVVDGRVNRARRCSRDTCFYEVGVVVFINESQTEASKTRNQGRVKCVGG